MARQFHRYLPAGLGQHRCGACNAGPEAEIHIAGLNEVSGGQMVRCPSCRRTVPMDYTIRTWTKQGNGTSVQNRLCRDCNADPEAGQSAAKRAAAERTTAGQLASLMNARDRGEITDQEYEERLLEVL